MRGFNPPVNTDKPGYVVWKLLVLAAVIGMVLFGWLAGHILRYSTLEFWHPPIEEINPRIKTGVEFDSEDIRRLAMLPENLQATQLRVYPGEGQINLFDGCVGNTYYTSLPAKCRSADGRLVRVGGSPGLLIPLDEWDWEK